MEAFLLYCHLVCMVIYQETKTSNRRKCHTKEPSPRSETVAKGCFLVESFGGGLVGQIAVEGDRESKHVQLATCFVYCIERK